MQHCVVCRHKLEFAFTKHGYKIFRCPDCGLFKTHFTRAYSHLAKTYYSKSYFTGSRTRAGYADYLDDAPVIRRNARMFLKLISSYLRPSARRLLDVGCATGTFLSQAQAQGFQVAGVDVSDYAVTAARRLFPRAVHHATLTTAKFSPASFDLIAFLAVFEHLPSPSQDLLHCHNLLARRGLLVINTGNTASFLAKIEGSRWHYFIPPQHLFFYSAANLTKLLIATGFKPLAVYVTGKHISLRYLWHLMRTINHSQLADWLYRHFHRTFIGKISLYVNLRDNMTIIAQKI